MRKPKNARRTAQSPEGARQAAADRRHDPHRLPVGRSSCIRKIIRRNRILAGLRR